MFDEAACNTLGEPEMPLNLARMRSSGKWRNNSWQTSVHACGSGLDRWSGFHPAGSPFDSGVAAPGGSGTLMPMRLANQRVSGKVSNMTATKSVIGNARKAPGPPRSQAQKTKDKKTMVGEMLSPRLIIIGERTFSARMLTSVTPTMTSTARVNPNSARARSTAGATANTSPM